jgi:uncharacterized protein YndB with AHSA1/START domain
MKIAVGVTIAAPPERVWAVLEPIEQHVEWMADAESITFTSGMTRGVGTEFDCVTRIGPAHTADHMVVTEWEPGRSMGIEHRGLVRGAGRFTLTERPGGRTRFAWTEELRFPWQFGGAAGAAAARPVLQAVWRRNLRRLQAIVEEHA